MGELHLEIIIDRLKREFKVEVNQGAPQVNYKEAINGMVEHREVYKKQTGGRGKFADIKFVASPVDADFEANDKNVKAWESKRLASAIYRTASRQEWEQKNVHTENPYVLRANTSAAALIEIGDIKNREQMQYIEDDTKLNELCRRILEGVIDANKK